MPDVPLQRVKDRLSEVRGHVVEAPLVRHAVLTRRHIDADLCVQQDFLIDDKEFATGVEWKGLNPTLPIYI